MVNKYNQKEKTSPAATEQFSEKCVTEIRRKLHNASQKNTADQIRKSVNEDIDCYGVTTTDTHKIGLDAVRKLRAEGLSQTIHIADALFQSLKYEEALIGGQLVGALARLISASDFENISPWVDLINSPRTADSFAINCISPCLAAKPSLVKTMREWARSDNASKRRSSISSFNPLVREGRFLTDALEVAAILMKDNNADVQRGVGTMLLEATRLQAGRVIEFLEEWKGYSSPNIFQIATSKLRPDQRSKLLNV